MYKRQGDTVIVRKAGDVIPEVLGPVLALRPEGAPVWHMPERCPSCDSPIIREEGEVAYRCISIDCPAQALERLLHWASRGALDIDGMGEEIVARLVESGRLADVADYYTLDEVELSLLDMGRVNKDGEPIRLGQTVAKKLVAAIEASRTRTFARALDVYKRQRRLRAIPQARVPQYASLARSHEFDAPRRPSLTERNL